MNNYCDDCLHKEVCGCEGAFDEALTYCKDFLSVSTEKTGHWIRWYEVVESADGKSTDHIPHCKCSECGCEYDSYSAYFIKYCNECGAKMQEVEE